ncbi:flavin reductase family protein [Bacillus sp. FJAT-45350]|uniref:flavin reductase family protein n=1 Tax=Bacillus sp. FJAT-45350 TaxID=2011014 RepID=UPI000BB83AC4|nr:flavin reductase family protein [Bacillus sp. FJAT-45350]
MKKIDARSLTRAENYKLLIGSVVPRPIAFVTSQNRDGIINGAPFSFFNIVTAEPPLISISVGRKPTGEKKDTSANIDELKEFVVHIVDETNVNGINQSSANYPSGKSEIEDIGFTQIPSEVVGVPSIKESKLRLECKLHQTIPLGGTEDDPRTDLIIGEVVYYHIADECIVNGEIDTDLLNPLSRLGKTEYGGIGRTFSLPRPKYEE